MSDGRAVIPNFLHESFENFAWFISSIGGETVRISLPRKEFDRLVYEMSLDSEHWIKTRTDVRDGGVYAGIIYLLPSSNETHGAQASKGESVNPTNPTHVRLEAIDVAFLKIRTSLDKLEDMLTPILAPPPPRTMPPETDNSSPHRTALVAVVDDLEDIRDRINELNGRVSL